MDPSNPGLHRAQGGRILLQDRKLRLQVRAEVAAAVQLCSPLPERAYDGQHREGLLPEVLQESTVNDFFYSLLRHENRHHVNF